MLFEHRGLRAFRAPWCCFHRLTAARKALPEPCYPGLPRRAPAPVWPFVVAPYDADAARHLEPQLPDGCPRAAVGAADSFCAVRVDHARPRKTGLEFAVTVCRCRPHRRGFALYPPGIAPYQRQAMLSVGPGGEPVAQDAIESAAPAPAPRLRRDFDETALEAAFDAAKTKPWARDSADILTNR